jgi:hypothetical protein
VLDIGKMKTLWPFHTLPCLHVWSIVKCSMGVPPEAMCHGPSMTLCVLLYILLWEGCPLLTSLGSILLASIIAIAILSPRQSPYWNIMIFEVYGWRRRKKGSAPSGGNPSRLQTVL